MSNERLAWVWNGGVRVGDIISVLIRVRGCALRSRRRPVQAQVKTIGTRANGVGDNIVYARLLCNHPDFGLYEDLFTIEDLDIELEFTCPGTELLADVWIGDPATERQAIHAMELARADAPVSRVFTLLGRPRAERACISDAFQDPGVAARVLLSGEGKNLRGRFVATTTCAASAD